MGVFFAIMAGAGTAAGLFVGFAVGHAVGYRDGKIIGRESMRDTLARIIARVRLELLARDAGGSELADMVLALLRESE